MQSQEQQLPPVPGTDEPGPDLADEKKPEEGGAPEKEVLDTSVRIENKAVAENVKGESDKHEVPIEDKEQDDNQKKQGLPSFKPEDARVGYEEEAPTSPASGGEEDFKDLLEDFKGLGAGPKTLEEKAPQAPKALEVDPAEATWAPPLDAQRTSALPDWTDTFQPGNGADMTEAFDTETAFDAAFETPAPAPLRPAAPVLPLAGSRRESDREEKVHICPILLVGSRLDKECPLRPNKWVEVGRNAKAQVLMQNQGVSKHHCKLLWKKGGSNVELRVLDGITHVNDRRLQMGSSMFLKHGDLLKIHGKGMCFRMILDMQPVDRNLPTVRSLANFTKKEDVTIPRSPEEDLRRKIKKLRAAGDAAREKAFQQEQRLTQVQTRRKLRAMGVQERLEKSRFYEKDERRLDDLLMASRDHWLKRLQAQSGKHAKDCSALTTETGEVQVKLDALMALKEAKEHQLHPERHAPVELKPAPSSPSSSSENEFAAKPGEADGENEAFPDALGQGTQDGAPPLPLAATQELADGSGAADSAAQSAESSQGAGAAGDVLCMDKPTIEVLNPAPAGADDGMADADLFGDFNSEEEGDAPLKRPASIDVDAEGDASLKRARTEL